MKFGIVTPVLNGSVRFRACAASVRRAADAAPGVSVLHLVRESDRSVETVEEPARAAGCVYTRGPDAGLYEAIAMGLDDAAAAGCDILAWINADEQVLPQAFGAVRRVFESNPRIGLVFGDYLLLGPEGRPIAARREIPARRTYLRNGVNYLLSCAVYFRRETWTSSARFDPTYPHLADKKFYLSLLRRGIVCSLLPEYLGAYAQTGENRSLDVGVAAEQARLRTEVGAFASPFARAAIRACRVAEKAFHGCYFRERIHAELVAHDGTPFVWQGRLSPFWRTP